MGRSLRCSVQPLLEQWFIDLMQSWTCWVNMVQMRALSLPFCLSLAGGRVCWPWVRGEGSWRRKMWRRLLNSPWGHMFIERTFAFTGAFPGKSWNWQLGAIVLNRSFYTSVVGFDGLPLGICAWNLARFSDSLQFCITCERRHLVDVTFLPRI